MPEVVAFRAKALFDCATTRRYGRPQMKSAVMTARRFPSPWSVEEGDTYFVVKDASGQKLGYVYFDDPRSADKPLTRDEARRIAANFAKLPDLLSRRRTWGVR